MGMPEEVDGVLRTHPVILWSRLGSIASKLFEFTNTLQTALLAEGREGSIGAVPFPQHSCVLIRAH